MTPAPGEILVLLLGSTIILTLPGLALLAAAGLWGQWPGLQRWIVAVSASIALYPVLFYGWRFVLAGRPMPPWLLPAALFTCALFLIWREKRRLLQLVQLSSLEWVAVIVVLGAVVTRLWVALAYPFPAWTDSLHHALLTKLTVEQGNLPSSLEPYFPVPLQMYHLGLYALTSSVMQLTAVPAHTALLWTAQILNALAGIGVYFVLDRKVGRIGALAGAVAVSFLYHQPAFYVNWGRDTQLASQTILLVAWLVTYETAGAWSQGRTEAVARRKLWANSLVSAVLTSAVFLFHFRVAAFYVALAVPSFSWLLFQGLRRRRFWHTVLGLATIALLALVLVLSVLAPAVPRYFQAQTSAPAAAILQPEQAQAGFRAYYEFPVESILQLGIHTPMLLVTAALALLGLLRLNKVTLLSIAWTVLLFLIGYAYLAGVPLLNLTNLGAVLIMLYLPAGLAFGAGIQELANMGGRYFSTRTVTVVAVAALLVGAVIFAPYRTRDVEQYRYLVTNADLRAMAWIRERTPPDSLFAVNTAFWLPTMPHGTDAGYWIPYLTERRITAGVMLLNLAPVDEQEHTISLSRAVEQAATDSGALAALREQGVDYIYIGERGSYQNPQLNPSALEGSPLLETVYRDGAVAIFRFK